MGYVYKTSEGQTVEWGMCITSEGQTGEWGMCVKQARDRLLNRICVFQGVHGAYKV